jgi:hypothetical protein
MTLAETRPVMAQIATPVHPRAVAGVSLGGILRPWIARLRAVGRPELPS